MVNAIFAFGPGNKYFMSCGSIQRKNNLPAKLTSKLLEADVALVRHVVLGAGESYYVSWRTPEGGEKFQFVGLPENLGAWVGTQDTQGFSTRKISQLRISLGPADASYWVTDGGPCQWYNVPDGLDAALKKRKSPEKGWTDRPRLVSIGAGGNWVLITQANKASWAIDERYSHLKELLQIIKQNHEQGGVGFAIVQDIVLNPNVENHAVLVYTNGIVQCTRVPAGAKTDTTTIVDAFQRQYQAEEEQAELDAQTAEAKRKRDQETEQRRKEQEEAKARTT